MAGKLGEAAGTATTAMDEGEADGVGGLVEFGGLIAGWHPTATKTHNSQIEQEEWGMKCS